MVDFPNKLFPGSNTKDGFVGYFEQIFSREYFERVFILKGGPGTGKSTLMKRIAEYSDMSETVTRCHCSSDPNSLDGVILHNSRIAILDGTAPHVVDPVYPVCVDTIVNLADGLSKGELILQRDVIERISSEIAMHFRCAHGFAGAAQLALSTVMLSYRVTGNIKKCFEPIYDTLPPTSRSGKQISLFMSAMTPDGICDFCDSMKVGKAWFVNAPWGYDSTLHLLSLAQYANIRGYDVLICKSPIDAARVEQLILCGDKQPIVISTHKHFEFTASEYIDLHGSIERIASTSLQREMSVKYKMAISDCTQCLSEARRMHGELEAIYVAAMNFDVAQEAFEMIMQ